MTAARTANDLSVHMPLSEEGRALLNGPIAPRAYLDLLLKHKLHPDAALMMAHAMPKREAIWWGCQCHRLARDIKPDDLALIEAIEKWLPAPVDKARRAIFQAGDDGGFDRPVGFLAMAVYFSTGSISVPNYPEVAAKEHLTANMVASAVQLLANLPDPKDAEARFGQYFPLGLQVAAGKNRWKEKASG